MNSKNILLGIFLAIILAVILLTWGSIGSAALTLGLLLAGIFTALKKSLNRDPDDYFDMGN
jgi:hypothetical protein